MVDALRPYADGKTVVRFYGYIACCSVEGPELIVDRYEIGSCDAVVPVRRATWGTLKTHYR